MILRNRNVEHFFKYILSACLMDSLHFFEYVNQLCTGFYKCRKRLPIWCPSSATNKQTITLNNKQNHIAYLAVEGGLLPNADSWGPDLLAVCILAVTHGSRTADWSIIAIGITVEHLAKHPCLLVGVLVTGTVWRNINIVTW